MGNKLSNPFEALNERLNQLFNAINNVAQKVNTVDSILADINEKLAKPSNNAGLIDELVTTEIAVRQLSVHKNTLMALIHNGDLPARKIGGRYKFMRSDIEKYVQNSSTQPEAAPALRGIK